MSCLTRGTVTEGPQAGHRVHRRRWLQPRTTVANCVFMRTESDKPTRRPRTLMRLVEVNSHIRVITHSVANFMNSDSIGHSASAALGNPTDQLKAAVNGQPHMQM